MFFVDKCLFAWVVSGRTLLHLSEPPQEFRCLSPTLSAGCRFNPPDRGCRLRCWDAKRETSHGLAEPCHRTRTGSNQVNRISSLCVGSIAAASVQSTRFTGVCAHYLHHQVTVQLTPLDNPLSAELFLSKWQPQVGIIMVSRLQGLVNRGNRGRGAAAAAAAEELSFIAGRSG